MTDTTCTPQPKQSQGTGKIFANYVAIALGTYFINRASLHGIDFQLWGIDSEMIKSAVIAAIGSFIVWVTPAHIVESIKDAIIFIRKSWAGIKQAAKGEIQ